MCLFQLFSVFCAACAVSISTFFRVLFILAAPIEIFSTDWLPTLSNIVTADVSTLLGTDICSGAGAGSTTSPRTGFFVRTVSGTALMSVLLVGWGNVFVFGANATGAIGSSCCSNSKLIITIAVTNNIQATIIQGWWRCHVLSKLVLLWCPVKSASSAWLVGLKTSLWVFASDVGLTLLFAMRVCELGCCASKVKPVLWMSRGSGEISRVA